MVLSAEPSLQAGFSLSKGDLLVRHKRAFALSMIGITKQVNGFSDLPLSSQWTWDLPLTSLLMPSDVCKTSAPGLFLLSDEVLPKGGGIQKPTAVLTRCNSRDCLPLSEYNIYIRMNQELFMFHLKSRPRHLVSFFLSNEFDKKN